MGFFAKKEWPRVPQLLLLHPSMHICDHASIIKLRSILQFMISQTVANRVGPAYEECYTENECPLIVMAGFEIFGEFQRIWTIPSDASTHESAVTQN